MLFAVLSPKKISGNLCWSPEISCSRLVFYFTVHLTGCGSDKVWRPLLWSKWRDSNPRPFGPEPKILPLFPALTVCFLGIPSNARCCRLFPSVSLLFRLSFQLSLNRTFWRFLYLKVCNPTLQPFGLQHGSSLPWNKPYKKLIRRINRNGSPGEMRSVSCNNAIYA